MNREEEALWLAQLAAREGYIDIKPLIERPGHWSGTFRFMFTHAIIVGRVGNDSEYEDRWCYHDYPSCKAAWEAWNGAGEPAGWHRHPTTGRRVREDGTMYVSQ